MGEAVYAAFWWLNVTATWSLGMEPHYSALCAEPHPRLFVGPGEKATSAPSRLQCGGGSFPARSPTSFVFLDVRGLNLTPEDEFAFADLFSGHGG